jgi:hypothetical protein
VTAWSKSDWPSVRRYVLTTLLTLVGIIVAFAIVTFLGLDLDLLVKGAG